MLGKRFLDITPKLQRIKEIIDKWNIIKIKNFGSLNNTDEKLKRETTHGEKIFANCTTSKEIVSRTYIEHSKLNKTTNNQIKKEKI